MALGPTAPETSPSTLALLRLRSTPGLGPVLLRRLVERFGAPDAADHLDAGTLQTVEGIGPDRARKIVAARSKAAATADAELHALEQLGARLIGWDDPEFPPLLKEIHDVPPILSLRGNITDIRFSVGIVGARQCTGYGLDQAGRFAEALSTQGLTIVSGGARGVDTAAHRGALRANGSTVAVLGCGLAHTYPPENADLFDAIARRGEQHGDAAVISELPANTPPKAENFPARNRLVSGMSLGVLVVEAGMRSGALITARLAAEDHNREVMAIPGRTTDAASQGVNELIRSGGATLVTHPSHVVEQLESHARHLHAGTHDARFASKPLANNDLFNTASSPANPEPPPAPLGLTPPQQAVLDAIGDGATLDDLVTATARPANEVLADLTMLELSRAIERSGPQYRRRTGVPNKN